MDRSTAVETAAPPATMEPAAVAAPPVFVEPEAEPAPVPRSENPAIGDGRLTLTVVEDLLRVPLGSGANGRWGDVLLGNEHIACIFGSMETLETDPQRAASLLDLTRVATQQDFLLALLPNHGGRNVKMIARGLETRETGYPDHAAAVVTRHESREKPGLFVVTEYILAPGSEFLQVVATWENRTDEAIEDLDVGDLMEWTRGNSLIPGRGFLELGKPVSGQSEYFAVIQNHDSYMFAPKSGTVRVEALGGAMNLTHATVTLPAGESSRVERRVYVGGRDLAAQGGKVYEYQGVPYGWIAGRLNEVTRTQEGTVVDLGGVADGEIQVTAAKRGGKLVDSLPFTRGFTNRAGEFIIPLPEGSYHVRGHKLGHIQPEPNYGVVVEPNQTTPLGVTLGPACRLELHVVDSTTSLSMPCKVTFENMINTRPLHFGPPDALAGGNAYYSATGRETILVEPGNYRVVVSRGPEYETVEKMMRLQAGRTHTLETALRRVVPTNGWIGVDIGVKTDASRGCRVSPHDRVVAAAAEGVEFIVSGDEGVATDLSSAIAEAGLDRWIASGIGMEISATWKNPLGLFHVFPVEPDAPPPPSGPIATGEALFERLRALYPEALLTVLRPIFPDVGYYVLHGYDPQVYLPPAQEGFSSDYDLLEVWEGKRAGGRQLTLPIFWTELFAGRRPGLVAGSRSTSLQDQEVGYPRTYVAVSTDDPRRVTAREVAESLRAGRVQITNGPFIDFKVQGQGPGALVQAVDGHVDIEMRVYASPWVNTYSFALDQNSMFVVTNISPSGEVKEVMRFPFEGEKTVRRIPCRTDSVFNATVMGVRSMAPVVSPFARGDQGQVVPFAMTGPVFVDATGDGQCNPTPPTAYRHLVEEDEEIED